MGSPTTLRGAFAHGVKDAFAKFASVPLPPMGTSQKEILDGELDVADNNDERKDPKDPEPNPGLAMPEPELPRLLNRGAEPPPATPGMLMDDQQHADDPHLVQQQMIDLLSQRMHPAGMQ